MIMARLGRDQRQLTHRQIRKSRLPRAVAMGTARPAERDCSYDACMELEKKRMKSGVEGKLEGGKGDEGGDRKREY